jgi:hypothetical protein
MKLDVALHKECASLLVETTGEERRRALYGLTSEDIRRNFFGYGV